MNLAYPVACQSYQAMLASSLSDLAWNFSWARGSDRSEVD